MNAGARQPEAATGAAARAARRERGAVTLSGKRRVHRAGYAPWYQGDDFSSFEVWLGRRCNQHCPFCSVADLGPDLAPTGEVSRWFTLGARAFRRVMFCGGEPTIRRDLFTLLRLAREAGFERAVLLTNGLMLAYPEFLRRVLDAGALSIGLSLHHHADDALAALSGHPRTGPLVKRALAALAEAQRARPEMFLYLSCVVSRRNVSDLAGYVRFLAVERARTGLRFMVAFALVRPEGGALRNFDQFVPRVRPAAAAVAEACARLAAEDIPAVFYHFPLCAVPPEWMNHSGEIYYDDVYLHPPDLRPEPATGRDFTYGPECATCVHRPACVGLPSAYAARFGFEELAPVLASPGA
ncbi:MAG: radical SAM protein [Planctomycetes bacterium]|nr:radical SAM protein [Planctomycetota bacterium]